MAASMCNVGLVRRQLFLLVQRKSESRHLLLQRVCSTVTSKTDTDQEDQMSQSPLIAEDDYFGVSIPEVDWSIERCSSLSKDEIFKKYGVDRLTEHEKDKMQNVKMPFGTVRFDTVADMKRQKDTREMFHHSNPGVREKILDSMAHVSSETENSGEKYYISILKQFKKDPKHETTGSKKSVSDAQSKRAQRTELRTADSIPEQTIQSTNKTVAHEQNGKIFSTKTSQCRVDQPTKVGYGNSAILKEESHNEERNVSYTNMNFIDQQYFQQDVVQTNSDNSTRQHLKTLQKLNSQDVIPELDSDMLVANTLIGKETCSENTEIFSDQEITSSHVVVGSQIFNKTYSGHASQIQKSKEPQHRQKHKYLTPESQHSETTGNSRTKSTDMNFIDQQFFGEYLSEDQSSKEISTHNNDQDQKSDLNFIDEEYFKETVSISARKTNELSTLEHRKPEEEKESTSDHKEFEKDVHKYSDNKKMSKRNKKRSDEESQLLQGTVMDQLERDAVVKRKRALLETKKTEWEDVMDSAYGAVKMLRNDEGRNLEGGAPLRDSRGMKVMKTMVPQLHMMTSVEIVNMITRHILYDSDDIVAIYKPYGLPSHGGPGVAISVAHLMGQISKNLKNRQNLHMVHRLDKDTTGVMLLARTKSMAARLTNAFAERRVVKRYWAITKGIPHPQEGIIDIPMMEGSVDGKNRMVLKPNFLPDGRIATKSSLKTFKAETHFKVISSKENTAIVECLPLTGVRHQLRAHLSFGLNTPVLGDHKYSNLLNFAPQKLDATTLKRLGVQQSKARYIPLHLHAMSILIPEFLDGRNLFVTSNLPKHFCRNMRNLKLNPAGNKK